LKHSNQGRFSTSSTDGLLWRFFSSIWRQACCDALLNSSQGLKLKSTASYIVYLAISFSSSSS
jgi:hypothetical protein